MTTADSAKAFASGRDWWNNADMLFASMNAADDTLAAGFKRAGDVIVAAVEERKESTELMFFPVAYNYRHYFELILKDVIKTGEGLDLIEISKTKRDKVLGRHDLLKLLDLARQVLIEFYAQDFERTPDALDHAESVVREFATHDPSGQEFRYARGKDGKRHLQEIPRHVNLRHLKEEVTRAGAFLEGCSYGMSEALSYHLEMKAEYEAEYMAEMRAEYEAEMRAEYEADYG